MQIHLKKRIFSLSGQVFFKVHVECLARKNLKLLKINVKGSMLYQRLIV